MNTELSSEAYLIGALLIDPPETLRRVRPILDPDTFEDRDFRTAWAAALDFERDGRKIDAAAILEELRRRGVAVEPKDLVELMRNVPTIESTEDYAQRVLDAADRRSLLQLLSGCTADLLSGADAASARDRLRDGIRDMAARGTGGLVTSAEAVDELYDKLTRAAAGERFTVPTGYGELDYILGGGVRKSGLTVLAARPGCGKTAVSLQMADRMAKRGIKTLYVSLEMPPVQLQLRRTAVFSGAGQTELASITETDDALWKKTKDACSALYNRSLVFNRSMNLTVPRIARLARQSGAGVVFIDYLGLIRPGRGKTIYEQVTAVSADLKQMALDLDIPVVCMAQLNRNGADTRPRLHELRDSGAIEQDADAVILQWLPGEIPEPGSISPAELELIVAKNRHGPTGKLTLSWYMNCGRIVGLERRH